MASRRRLALPPQIQALVREIAGRAGQEIKNSLARASSEMFQSLARDASRVPAAVEKQAVKLQDIIDDFVTSIANEEIDDKISPDAPTMPQTPVAKAKAKAKRKRKKPAKGPKR